MFARKFVFAIAACLAVLGNSGVKAATCNKVEVTVVPFSKTVKSTMPARKMLDMMLAGRAHNTSDESMALGMVLVKEDNKIKVVRDESECRVFQVKVGFEPATVYLAHELTESQCAYSHVRNHELEHVRLYEDFLAELGVTLTRGLSEILAQDAEVDSYKAADLMYKAISAEFAKVYDKQHALDSNDTYLRNERVCRGAVMKIAKGA